MHILKFQNEKVRIFRDGLTLFERNCGYQSQFSFSHILIYLRLLNCSLFAKNQSRIGGGVVWNNDNKYPASLFWGPSMFANFERE